MNAVALYLTALALSTCGLVFELVAATSAAYLSGDSVTRFATVVGTHLSAMGVGAWLTRHVHEQPGRRLLEAQLGASLAGAATAPAVFLAYGRGAWMLAVLYAMWWCFCVSVERPELGPVDVVKAAFAATRAHPIDTLLIAAIGLGVTSLLGATMLGAVPAFAFTGMLTAVAWRRLSR